MDKQGNIELEDLPGVGPATAEKLKEAGFNSVVAIAVASPAEVVGFAEIGESTAQKIINAARQHIDIGGFEVSNRILQQRSLIDKISFGTTGMDDLMGGGIETKSITELYGKNNSDMTELWCQIAVNVQLPTDEGGLSGSVIIIDTKNNFRPENIIQVVNELCINTQIEHNAEDFLKNIRVGNTNNSNHQILLVDTATELANKLKDTDKPVRLLVVDSLTAHFMNEYIGRGMLADRQQKLNKHMNELTKFANQFNAAVVVVNQVSPNDTNKSLGGSIVSHYSIFRLYLRKYKGAKIVRLVDSPNLAEGEAIW